MSDRKPEPTSETKSDETSLPRGEMEKPTLKPLYIRRYRVIGAHELPQMEVEEAVYPFLGPGRTADDVEGARAALQKAYQAKGFQGASVQIPAQTGRRGIVILEVSEGKVGQVRVKGARYFLPSVIKAKAQSLAEGRAVNFNDVTRDIVALNLWPDRQVTPSMVAGAEPGLVDIDLTVKDKFPLHGSIELNNRYSADTTPLRLSGALSYNNLWQAGHSIGGNFQLSPEDWSEVKVFSGYYIARVPNVDWLSLMLQATKQDSNVSTLGSIAVAGRGEVYGGRAIITLPSGPNFYQSFNAGFDYKHFNQAIEIGETTLLTPITYYPISANYSATWSHPGKSKDAAAQGDAAAATTSAPPKNSVTEFNAGVTLGIRGVGNRSNEFENNRFKADSNFIYIRSDLSHTHELPGGFQAYLKVHGQIADQPLVNSEQFAGGGLGSARGYLEAEVLGDNAIFGTAELRSPALLGWGTGAFGAWGKNQEWRIYAFGDVGALSIHEPLPQQASHFQLASFGIGSRIELSNHFNGSLDLAIPAISQANSQAGDLLFTFRVSADF